MSRRLAFTLVGAILVVASLLWLRSRPQRAGEPGLEDAQIAAAARSELEPSQFVPAQTPESIDEETGGAREALAVDPLEEEAEAERVLVTVSARFVDENGRPLAGVELSASSIASSPVAVSDSTGLAELVLDWESLSGFFPQPCSFLLRGPGLATRGDRQHFRRPEDRFLGEILMLPGGDLRGRVVDPAGRGIAGAVIRSIHPVLADSPERDELRTWGGKPLSTMAVSESAGSFVLAGLPVMVLSIDAQGAGTYHAISAPFTVRAGETIELPDLVLEPAPIDHQIGGVVRTERGEPVQGAGIRLLDEERGYIRARVLTDELGAFRFAVMPGELYALQVLDYSTKGWPDVNLDEIEPGTTDLEIVFQDTRSLLVRVTGPEGRPVRRFQATISGADGRVVPSGSELSEDGSPLSLKVPRTAFRVMIYAPGYAFRKESYDHAQVGEELTLVLERTVGLAGRVTAGGKPVSGAVVDAHPALDEGRTGLVAGVFHVTISPRYFMGDRTGADGEFFLNVPEPTRLHVHASADGFARADSGLIDFDPAQGSGELLFELSPGGALEGHVLVGPHAKASGRTVALSRGDGHFETVNTAADGAYRFDDLAPGYWQIAEVDARELEHAGGGSLRWVGVDEETPWDLEIVAGETTRFDLDLSGEEVYRLEGRFRVDDGPPVGWTWTVPMVRGYYNKTFDSNGAFAFEVEDPGTQAFLLNAPRTPGAHGALRVEMELFAGANSWEGEIQTGTLELSGLEVVALADVDTGGQVEVAYTLTWEGENALKWFCNVFGADQGRLRLIAVPAGRIRLYEGDYTRLIGGPEPAPLREIDLSPGETKTVTLD